MYQTILVPTDGSEGASAAAEHAVGLAERYGATVHALYVADVRMSPLSSAVADEDVAEMVEASEEDPTGAVLELADAAGVTAVSAVRTGVPHEAIAEYAAEHGADLIAMGTHGRTGLERALLGSVTERVVRTADVPVLTVGIEAD